VMATELLLHERMAAGMWAEKAEPVAIPAPEPISAAA